MFTTSPPSNGTWIELVVTSVLDNIFGTLMTEIIEFKGNERSIIRLQIMDTLTIYKNSGKFRVLPLEIRFSLFVLFLRLLKDKHLKKVIRRLIPTNPQSFAQLS